MEAEGVLATDVDDAAARAVLAARGAAVTDEPGGGLLAVFAHAPEAVGAALALRDAGLLHQARAGVADGPLEGPGDASTRPAARRARALRRLGRAGVLLVTARLADRAAADHPPQERWFLTLSDLAGPEPVVAILPRADVVRPAATFPLPGPVQAASTTPFVGREAELEVLRDRWRAACAGGRGVVAVRGDAGIGKSRLVAALAAEVHAAGGLVLAGHFDDGAAPHQPFADALRFFVGRSGARRLRDELGPAAGELVRLAPELAAELGAPRPAPGDADLEGHRLAVAVDGWLAAAAAPGGLLLALDDAHLAAPDAVGLLAHLARSTLPARLLVVLASRGAGRRAEGAPGAGRAWEELERLAGGAIDDLALQPFAPAEVADVAAAHAPRAAGMVRRAGPQLAAATGGNALFVVQLARHLAESEPAAGAGLEGELLDAIGVPTGVRDVLDWRLERLGGTATDVLSRAAVVGDPIELEVLRAVVDVDLDDEAFAAAVADGVARGLLQPVGPGVVGFEHALVRAALADRLGATRRARLHGRVADAILARLGGDLDSRAGEVARHLLAAGGHDPRTFDLARRAGNQALQRLAYADAAAMFTAADASMPANAPPPVREDVALGLATARHLAGRPGAAGAIVEVGMASAARGDGERAVRAALACHRGFFGRLAGVDEARVGLLRRAIALHAARDADRARLLARLAVELSFDPDPLARQALAEEAVAIARSLPDAPDVLVDALAAAQHTAYDPARLDERLLLTAELVDVADGTDDLVLRTRARWHRADALREAGRFAEATDVVDEAIALAERVGQPPLLWASRVARAGNLATAGRLAEAEAEATATLRLGTAAGQPDAVLFYGGVLFQIRYEEGRLPAVADLYRPFAEDPAAPPIVAMMQAVIDCEEGDVARARDRLGALATDGFASLPADDLRLAVLALAVEVAVRTGDRAAAAALDAALAPAAGALVITAGGAVGTTGAVDHFRGALRLALGDAVGGVALLEAALARHAAIGAPIWVNRSRVALAGALADRDPARAEALATVARDACAALGLVALRGAAEAVLARR